MNYSLRTWLEKMKQLQFTNSDAEFDIIKLFNIVPCVSVTRSHKTPCTEVVETECKTVDIFCENNIYIQGIEEDGFIELKSIDFMYNYNFYKITDSEFNIKVGVYYEDAISVIKRKTCDDVHCDLDFEDRGFLPDITFLINKRELADKLSTRAVSIYQIIEDALKVEQEKEAVRKRAARNSGELPFEI
ncbi:MAG: hypothetical protein IKX00_02320 [Bacilli bacterium]|nr:hypothetical protein [Bacilli bacterium]